MTQLTQQSMVKAVHGQVSCTVEGEAVILHLDDGVYFGLNTVGTFIWNELKTGKRVSQLADEIAGEFEITREQALEDLYALLDDLQQNGLIEVVPERTA